MNSRERLSRRPDPGSGRYTGVEVEAIRERDIKPLSEEMEKEGVVIDSSTNLGEGVSGLLRLRTKNGGFTLTLDVLSGLIETYQQIDLRGTRYQTNISNLERIRTLWDEAWNPFLGTLLNWMAADYQGLRPDAVRQVIKRGSRWGYPTLENSRVYREFLSQTELIGGISDQFVKWELDFNTKGSGEALVLANKSIDPPRRVTEISVLVGRGRLQMTSKNFINLISGRGQAIHIISNDMGIFNVQTNEPRVGFPVLSFGDDLKKLYAFLCDKQVFGELQRFLTPPLPEIK